MSLLTIKDIQIRDPFIVPREEEGKYYMYGSTDANIWGKGTGFDAYVSTDLSNWEGPFPVFRPDENFFADNNFWAPEVYAYKDKCYMFATFRRRDNDLLGTAILVSDQLLGPFTLHSDGPVTPKEWSSLDGSLHVDEQGIPWMIFCHEWQQVGDGEVCAVQLSEDLYSTLGEPILLFTASEAAWTTPYISPRYPDTINYVTDGPYVFRTDKGQLRMLWASFIDNTYALGVAESVTGEIKGPWIQANEAVYRNDGGHGMVFRTFEGKLLLALHTPNNTPDERPVFLEIMGLEGSTIR